MRLRIDQGQGRADLDRQTADGYLVLLHSLIDRKTTEIFVRTHVRFAP